MSYQSINPFNSELVKSFGEQTDQQLENGGDISQFLMPVEAALNDVPELAVTPTDAANLTMGRSVLIRGRDAPVLSGPMFATCKGRIIALGEVEKGALHPTRVFNLG